MRRAGRVNIWLAGGRNCHQMLCGFDINFIILNIIIVSIKTVTNIIIRKCSQSLVEQLSIGHKRSVSICQCDVPISSQGKPSSTSISACQYLLNLPYALKKGKQVCAALEGGPIQTTFELSIIGEILCNLIGAFKIQALSRPLPPLHFGMLVDLT